MARKTEQCLSYFSLDTDFFFNPKIMALTDSFGIKGVYLLLFIYCAIYGNYGYYMIFDYSHISLLKRYGIQEQDINDILNHLRKYGFLKVVNLNPNTVFGTCDGPASCASDPQASAKSETTIESPRVAINFDSQIDSIDKSDIMSPRVTDSLITDDGLTTLLITGRSIQEQFNQSVSKLSKKFTVDANLWLLSPSQTSKSITVSNKDQRFPDLPPLDSKIYSMYIDTDESPDFSRNLQDSPENSRFSVKKGKERKEKRKEKKTQYKESDPKDPPDPSGSGCGGDSPKAKKSKPKDPPKKQYGEFGNVMLADHEYDTLLNKKCKGYQQLVDYIIEKLDSYKESSGKIYVSDYGAINNWVYKRACEDMGLDPKNLVVPKPPKEELVFGETREEFEKHAAEFGKAHDEELKLIQEEWEKTHPSEPIDVNADNLPDLISSLATQFQCD